MPDNKPLIYYFRIGLFIIGCLTINLFGQTRSRISGSVHDAETSEPLIGVNIIVEDTELGAASDANGNYIIINVPVGTHRVRASMMGYEIKVLTDVMVSADRITRLEF
ncbi:MAG: carboxypeptidase-like regulatory domain-containing protein [Candidatus Neomarinimicrobiota bacterium]|jgi:hypothetical protein